VRPPTLLVVAKAPVPGQVKTRLTPPLSPHVAADVAAAALLDTLASVCAAAAILGGERALVALDGDVEVAARRGAIRAAVARCEVLPQRGDGLGERLAAAHADAAARRPGRGTVQVGMDTPQAEADLLVDAAGLLRTAPAALGAASDGGWWLLALRDPRHARVLAALAMSRADTGRETRRALLLQGLAVAELPELRDVDTWDDARAVAAHRPGSGFAAAVRQAAAS
jgi:glycosyltransferase A (GT-A) superfamily protein (DUF2064 family)